MKTVKIKWDSVRSALYGLRDLPRIAWVLVILAFILGFLIRAGGES